ncbi:hypothetical protein [Actinomycetospora corticicola]|uniref:Uncharacterized protein n=1 Tax=Actinomycetospora corticicola TaxID=663602 RepID=A0A7Y9J5I4_9PSEU|nr:hypothetical protein [Actinomycetospora corticicola]NYD36145.1 hypothetical protein [Actinomycetospora corticicola]
MTDNVVLQGARSLSRWAVREYADIALRLDSYKSLVARTKPLNDSVVALMSFDPSALRRADEAVAAAGGVARRVTLGDVAESTRAAASGAPAKAALAEIEFVLDAHHVIESRWHRFFESEFESLGWKTPDDMLAIAIPTDIHQRELSSLAKRLGVAGGPSPSQTAQFKQVTEALQRRILDSKGYNSLSAAERDTKRYWEIVPGQTTARKLVEAHRDVYAKEEGLKWLSDIVEPKLVEILNKLP